MLDKIINTATQSGNRERQQMATSIASTKKKKMKKEREKEREKKTCTRKSIAHNLHRANISSFSIQYKWRAVSAARDYFSELTKAIALLW